MLLRWLLWIAVVYLLVVSLAWAFQERLLYLPHVGREHVGTPADRGLPWEEVALETEDGLTLDAWWVPAQPARGSLLFFHGNAGNISHRLDSIRQFHRLGLSVLILDYRGYGRSEGSPSEAGTALDARAAWRWMVEERGLPPEEIVLFGRSLGAAVAAELAASRDGAEQPAAVILESSFRSVPRLGQRLYPFLPVRWLARLDYDTESRVAQIEAPLLVIHSRDDEIIPFAEGEAVYRAANDPKRLLEIRGGHNTGFLDSEPDYSSGIEAFLDELSQLPRR
ncbi:alpha/beta hydrolase [Halomonas campisalis]|uniref:Alpha/beta hydrolase n=1 Tax=Billgrantia campisalis TaxID=74661 RepID=A0ABS9P732_9GAMM|nr:alpha/beta hydrolase [Halomonas campisalis]MCG6657583.1 alpha/beta hydrolase [Halomonas campisalis]MDR5862643.1 alpha/beta hydrolase [Halomonas campisalis]